VVPFECVVRGYLSGSGWKEYRQTGAVCSVALPAGLIESDRLPEPIFTPATKEAVGTHDQNVSFDRMVRDLGERLAVRLRDTSLAVYARARDIADARGIILADTKFEFGLAGDELLLVDEVLTPDSSRFWPKDAYKPGGPQLPALDPVAADPATAAPPCGDNRQDAREVSGRVQPAPRPAGALRVTPIEAERQRTLSTPTSG
jgi:phosphoribosylaminoimidazole-succinocarboxamide synthase